MVDVGYARVSTRGQNLESQIDALTAAGCEKVFADKASGKLDKRPHLDEAQEYMRSGDRLTVVRLDRLGRSLPHLVATVCGFKERGIEFRSLHEQIDTGSAVGKLTFHMFCALAEFYADLNQERTMDGLAAARERGRVGGRRPVVTEHKLTLAQQMHAERLPDGARKYTGQQIADALSVSRAALYRAFAAADGQPKAS